MITALSIIAGLLGGIFVKICEIHKEIKKKGGKE